MTPFNAMSDADRYQAVQDYIRLKEEFAELEKRKNDIDREQITVFNKVNDVKAKLLQTVGRNLSRRDIVVGDKLVTILFHESDVTMRKAEVAK